MAAPKPRDPNAPTVTPEELTRRFEEILEQPVASLHDEASMLTQAHDLLHDALQGN